MHTWIAFVLIVRCCPTEQSDLLQSSYLLHLTPGIGGSLHPLRVRRPKSRLLLSLQPKSSMVACLFEDIP